jgi:hypothetical protein
VVIYKHSDTLGETATEAEVFLQGEDAGAFLRAERRAEQKERSKRGNPNNISLRQNVMAERF